MRCALVTLVLAAALVAQPAFPVETRTSEGVRVWDFGNEDSNRFAFVVFVAVGSRLERSDEGGMAHLVEHCLFRSTRRRSYEEVQDLLDRAKTNGFTYFDQTVYHFDCDPTAAPALIDLFGEMITQPAFIESEVETEQKIVYEEISRGDRHVHDKTFQDLIYPGDPLGRTVGGDRDRVRAFSLASVRGFYREHYRRGNVIVAFSGGGDRDLIRQSIDQAFQGLPEGGGGRPPVSAPEGRSGTRQVGNPLAEGGIDITGFHVPERTTTNLAALWVMEMVLYDRLREDARETSGLAYSPSVRSVTFLDAWRIEARLESSSRENIRKLDEIVTDIARDLPNLSERDFREARAAVIGGLRPDDAEALAESVYKTWLLLQQGVTPPDPIRELLALTRDDFVELARTLDESRRYRLTNDPMLAPGGGAPWLAIFGVLIGGLLIVDAFFGFRAVRGLLDRPAAVLRAVRDRFQRARRQRRAARRRRADVNALEGEIQEWFAQQEEPEERRPHGE